MVAILVTLGQGLLALISTSAHQSLRTTVPRLQRAPMSQVLLHVSAMPDTRVPGPLAQVLLFDSVAASFQN